MLSLGTGLLIGFLGGQRCRVYRFPTPEPEADGTLQWNATTASP